MIEAESRPEPPQEGPLACRFHGRKACPPDCPYQMSVRVEGDMVVNRDSEGQVKEKLSREEWEAREQAIGKIKKAVDKWLAEHETPEGIDRNALGQIVEFLGREHAALVEEVMAAFSDREKCVQRPAVKIYAGRDGHAPDIWLLGWRAGEGGIEETDIHDHADSEAAIHVSRGTVEEVIYAFDKAQWSRNEPEVDFQEARRGLREGSTATIEAPYIHVVRGQPGQELAVTIHGYYPPLDRMNFYRVDGGKLHYQGSWDDPERQHC